MKNIIERLQVELAINMKLKWLLLIAYAFGSMQCITQEEPWKVIKNDMKVNWYYQNDSIYFELEAPTHGWIAIGFGESTQMKDVYVLMGRVVDNNSELVEYYTTSPGQYDPLTDFGVEPRVNVIDGLEQNGLTRLQFSLPVELKSKYQKSLKEKSEYHLTMAYSREDDFNHHSVMRTMVLVKL